MNIKINKPISKLINKMVLLLPIVFFNFLLTNTASAIVAVPSFGIGAVTHNSASNGSCRVLLDDGNTADGVYMIDPFDNGNSFAVYCDMTTDEGGWTLVVGINGDNRNHINQSTVTFTTPLTATSTGKLSDDVINQIANLEGSDHLLRFTCNNHTDYFYIDDGAPDTKFNAIAANTTIINAGWNTYSEWLNTPTSTIYNGHNTVNIYRGISNHGNSGWGNNLIYGRTGNLDGCRQSTFNKFGTVYVR